MRCHSTEGWMKPGEPGRRFDGKTLQDSSRRVSLPMTERTLLMITVVPEDRMFTLPNERPASQWPDRVTCQ